MKYSYRVGNNHGRKNLSFDEMKSCIQQEVGEEFLLKTKFTLNGSEYGDIIKVSNGERCGVWIADKR